MIIIYLVLAILIGFLIALGLVGYSLKKNDENDKIWQFGPWDID